MIHQQIFNKTLLSDKFIKHIILNMLIKENY